MDLVAVSNFHKVSIQKAFLWAFPLMLSLLGLRPRFLLSEDFISVRAGRDFFLEFSSEEEIFLLLPSI